MNPVISSLSPTATRMIRMDHTHVLTMFHKLEPDTSASVREATTRNICTALDIHATLEEEIFYPALREVAPDEPVLADSVQEHAEMRAMVTEVRNQIGSVAGHDDALAELMRAVMHHMAEEETVLLPLAERHLGSRLAELGARMTERRLELARPRAGQLAKDLVRASPGKAAVLLVGTLAAAAVMLGNARDNRRAAAYES